MKKTILISIVLGLQLACGPNKEEPKTDSESEIGEIRANTQLGDSVQSIEYITNDSITNSWITELTRITKSDNRFKVETELRPNRHWDYMDTIKTLTYNKSRLTVLSTEDYYGLWTADLKDPEIPLWNNVKIGMEKQQMEKIVRTNMLSDKIEIGNTEKTTVFKFEFIEGKLAQIYVVGFVD